jgi:2-methylcitrate dehydratase PrpD
MRGFKGVKDPLESRQGYFALYGNKPCPENAVADLGRVYYVQGMHKMHPSCYGNHNPIESALELVRSHDFDAADVEQISLQVPPHRVDMFLNQPVNADDSQPRLLFSIPYAIANVLLRKEVRIEHYTEENLRVPELLALTRKVRLVPNEQLTRNQQSRLGNLVGPDQVREKFWRNIDFSATVSRDKAAKALSMLDRLEDLDDISPMALNLVQ